MRPEREVDHRFTHVDNTIHGDPALSVQAGTIVGDVIVHAGRATPAIPRQLPAGSEGLVGRNDLLTRLDEALLPGGLATVTGMGGVGKTALVVQWARRRAADFANGQLYVDLHGFGPEDPLTPLEVLAGFLRALGQPRPEALVTLEERAAQFRTLMSGKRVLIVLDNARSAEQVRPLLPGDAPCAVVVISRHRLSGLVVHHCATALHVEPLRESDAVLLLRHVAGAGTARLVELCAGLPLALRIAAARMAEDALSDGALVDELAAEQGHLDFLDSGEDGRSAVRTVFSWSYRNLSESEARGFRVLGLHPRGPFSADAVSAMLGTHPRALLKSLARKNLIFTTGDGRFAMHDLLRAHARELGETIDQPGDRLAVLTGLFDHYLHTADRAGRIVMPHRLRPGLDGRPVAVPEIDGRAAALRWFDQERPTLEALCALDEPTLDGRRWQLAYVLRDYYFLNKLLDGWRDTHQHALAASMRAGDILAEARTRNNLGMVLVETGDLDEALMHYRRAEDLFERLGDEHGRSNALVNQASVLRRRGEFAAALDNQRRALEWYRRSERHRRNAGITLRSMSLVEMELGRYEDAVRHAEEAIALAVDLELDLDVAEALSRLGRIHRWAGHDGEAEIAFRRAVEHSRRSDSRHEEAQALRELGKLVAASGRIGEARGLLTRALELHHELGSAEREAVAAELDALPRER